MFHGVVDERRDSVERADTSTICLVSTLAYLFVTSYLFSVSASVLCM